MAVYAPSRSVLEMGVKARLSESIKCYAQHAPVNLWFDDVYPDSHPNSGVVLQSVTNVLPVLTLVTRPWIPVGATRHLAAPCTGRSAPPRSYSLRHSGWRWRVSEPVPARRSDRWPVSVCRAGSRL